MNSREQATPISDVLLEQFALGELDPDAMAAIEHRLAGDAELAARLDAIRRSDAEILAVHPPERFARSVRDRLERNSRATDRDRPPDLRTTRTPSRRRSWLLGVPVLAAAAVAAMLLLPPGPVPGDDPRGPGSGEIRTKGLAPHLNVYRRAGDEAERLADGATVTAGDVLQLSVVAGYDAFGVVVSIDGAGVVTRHFPEDPSGSTELAHDGEVPIPHAYELDAAPAFERFFLVTGAEPVSVATVEAAARLLAGDPGRREQGALELPDGYDQFSTILRKGMR